MSLIKYIRQIFSIRKCRKILNIIKESYSTGETCQLFLSRKYPVQLVIVAICAFALNHSLVSVCFESLEGREKFLKNNSLFSEVPITVVDYALLNDTPMTYIIPFSFDVEPKISELMEKGNQCLVIY